MQLITLTLTSIICFAFSLKSQWTPVASGTLAKLDAIHFFDAQNGYCAGSPVTLKTIDGGNTWTKTNSQGFRDFGFYDNTYGYGASIVSQSMAKTINGGSSWTSITPPTSNSLWAVDATSPSTAYFVGTGGVLWKTINSGATVTVENTGTIKLITDVVFTDPSTGFIVVQTGEIKKTMNSGTSWNTVATFPGGILTEMCFVNQNIGFVTGFGGMVAKTIDGGQNWDTLTTNSTSYLQGVDFFDSNHGIVVGNDGEILYTNDGGSSWIQQNSGVSDYLYDVRMLSATSAVVVGDNGIILKNDNITVGIEDNVSDPDVYIYPNPIESRVTIGSSTTINSIEIFDITGRLVLSDTDINTVSCILDLTKLSPGSYFVFIKSPKGNVIRKVIK